MNQLLEFVARHPILFTALAAIIVLFVLNEIVGNLTGGKRLSPLEAVRLINDRDAIVVDLRPVADFKRGHILNALSIPLAKLGERTTELSKSKERPVILYCALGGSAVQAADQLRKAGFAEVYPMQGGLNNWMGSSLPVTAQ